MNIHNLTEGDFKEIIDKPEHDHYITSGMIKLPLMNSRDLSNVSEEYVLKFLRKCLSFVNGSNEYTRKELNDIIGSTVMRFFDKPELSNNFKEFILNDKNPDRFLNYLSRSCINNLYDETLEVVVGYFSDKKKSQKISKEVYSLIKRYTCLAKAKLRAGATKEDFKNIIYTFEYLYTAYIEAVGFDEVSDTTLYGEREGQKQEYISEDGEFEGKYFDFLLEAWTVWHSIGTERSFADKNMKTLLELSTWSSGIQYEMHDTYFICFKSVLKDFSSCQCPYTFYEIGKEYEAACDDDLFNDASYGISAWDFDGAYQFCSERVLKLKVNYEDLRYVDLHDGKIRASKVKVLSEVNFKHDNETK